MEQSSFESRRRHKRHTLRGKVRVINKATGLELGSIANLSQEGIMLVNNTPLATENIYQLRLEIEDDASGTKTPAIDIGVDCLWVSPAGSDASTYWSGCQIIDVSDEASETILNIIRNIGQ